MELYGVGTSIINAFCRWETEAQRGEVTAQDHRAQAVQLQHPGSWSVHVLGVPCFPLPYTGTHRYSLISV